MSAPEQRCRLCGDIVAPFSTQHLLGKYDVQYFRCPRCDLIQSERPYWLEEAYSQALAALDTGALVRNQVCARLTLAAALVGGVAHRQGLDFGGGHGVLTRALRDFGLDFRWFDRYAKNLFARGFDGDIAQQYGLVTAFEVLEHFVDVADELRLLFHPRHDLIIVSTVLHESPPDDWWYYTPESGQHVAFYSARTMRWLGEREDYDTEIGASYTLFIRRDLRLRRWRRGLLARIVTTPQLAYAIASLVPDAVLLKLGPLRSYTLSDHDALRGQPRRP